MEGKVKFFNDMKGYGFVTGDDGKEYFVHRSDLPEGTTLKENDTVSFEPIQSDRGLQAKNVQLVAGSGKEAEETEEEEISQEDFGEE